MSWVRRLADVEQELALVEDEDERRKVWQSAVISVQRRPGTFITMLFFSMATVLPVTLAFKFGTASYVLGLDPAERFLFTLPLSAAIGLLFGTLWFRIRRCAYQTEVRRQLRARGIPVCLNCGYSLRGQTEPRCPECGRAFDPSAFVTNRAPESPS